MCVRVGIHPTCSIVRRRARETLVIDGVFPDQVAKMQPFARTRLQLEASQQPAALDGRHVERGLSTGLTPLRDRDSMQLRTHTNTQTP